MWQILTTFNITFENLGIEVSLLQSFIDQVKNKNAGLNKLLEIFSIEIENEDFISSNSKFE